VMTLITVLLLTGCASQPTTTTFDTFQAKDLSGLLTSGKYVQKPDNFFVINDSSSSMTEPYFGVGYSTQAGMTKFSVEKEILNRMNQTIPELKLTSSIRSFGSGACLGGDNSKLNLAPTSYSKATFASGMDAMTCASGISPIDKGVTGTGQDLSSTAGEIAVVILSDGHELETNGVAGVTALKAQYGDKLCVYPIWVGNEAEKAGQAVLSQLSEIAGCGFTTTADKIASPDGMANFVTQVFFKEGSDCSVLDGDNDGINDCDDKCPTTLPGVKVSHFGCWIVDIKFDNDKAIIKPQYYPNLDNAAKAIRDYPGMSFEVQGHTSKTGSYKHNMDLSERRALAVKNYLIKKSGSANISSRGFGWNQPVDTNATLEGQANNRRVQLEVDGQPQK